VFSTTADGASTSTERMRIKSDGVVQVPGIVTGGTSAIISPSTTTGAGCNLTSIGIFASRSANPCLQLQRTTSDGAIAQFFRQNTVVGSISVTASATAYNTSSDYRLKENVTLLTAPLLASTSSPFTASISLPILTPWWMVSLLTKRRQSFLSASLARRMQSMMTATPSIKASTNPSWCPC
jgi:hypothetical protein